MSEFSGLDTSLGAMGSLDRAAQHAEDPRWEPRYVVVRDGSVLRAALPIYLGHGTRWSDRIHSPSDWGVSEPPVQDRSALIGGRLEVRGSLRCTDDPAVLSAVASACADLPELRGRSLYLGYLDSHQRRLAETVFGPVDWLTCYEDYVYPREVVHGELASLPSDVRHLITHGERKIAEHGVTVEVTPWSAYEGSACDLIAAHNTRMGMSDHPELVRYRMDQWDECRDVTVLVAHARAGETEGAITLLVTQDEVEVYEIGMSEEDSPVRRTVYTCLTFHEPRRLAREDGRSTVKAGLDAGRSKLMRGAEAVGRHCGQVLAGRG